MPNRLAAMANDPKAKALAGARRAQRNYKRDVVKAREARRESFRLAQKAGLSLREIGKAVDLHPTRVREILRGE